MLPAKELQLLGEGLWEAVKADPEPFGAVKRFVQFVAEFDYTELSTDGLGEIAVAIGAIEKFFARYRPTRGSGPYMPPEFASANDDAVRRMNALVREMTSMSPDEVRKQAEAMKPKPKKGTATRTDGPIFIGHGRSRLWARVKIFLEDELGLTALSYESESHTGEAIVPVLEGFLERATFAILILTGEDETADGTLRARQNVVHEAGLFQGRLGFRRAVLLKQETAETFTNVAGLQDIPFAGDNVEQTFYELRRVLQREGFLK
jgi:predicted nucleotide-binding protein